MNDWNEILDLGEELQKKNDNLSGYRRILNIGEKIIEGDKDAK